MSLKMEKEATLRRVEHRWKMKRKLGFQWWDRRKDHRKDWRKPNRTRRNQRATRTRRGKWSVYQAKFDEERFIELLDPMPAPLNEQT